MAVYSFLPNVLPSDAVICLFLWICFSNFNKFSTPSLKSIHACL